MVAGVFACECARAGRRGRVDVVRQTGAVRTADGIRIKMKPCAYETIFEQKRADMTSLINASLSPENDGVGPLSCLLAASRSSCVPSVSERLMFTHSR